MSDMVQIELCTVMLEIMRPPTMIWLLFVGDLYYAQYLCSNTGQHTRQ